MIGKKNNMKAWLYLLPALIFIGVFMVYPLIDVFIYSFEENLHSEMEKIVLFNELPNLWTYPEIQPKLIEYYINLENK